MTLNASERKTPEWIVKQLRATNVNLINKNAKLEAEGGRLTQRIAEVLGENATLEKKLKEIRLKFWESDNKLTATESDLKEIHEKLEILRAQVTQSEVGLEAVRYDLEKAVSNEDVMVQENTSLRDEKQELMAKLEREVKAVDIVKKNKEMLEKEITALNETNVQLRCALKESESKLSTEQSNNRILSQKIEDSREAQVSEADLRLVKEDLEKETSSKELLMKENNGLRDENQNLVAKLKKEVKAVDVEKKKNKALTEMNIKLQNAMKEAESKHDKLIEESMMLRTEKDINIDDLKAELVEKDNLEGLVSSKIKENNKLSAEKEKLQNDLSNALKNIEASNVDQLRKETEVLKKTLQKKNDEINEIKENHQTNISIKLEENVQMCKDLTEKHSELVSKLGLKEIEIEEKFRTKLTRLTSEKEAVEEELKRLKENIREKEILIGNLKLENKLQVNNLLQKCHKLRENQSAKLNAIYQFIGKLAFDDEPLSKEYEYFEDDIKPVVLKDESSTLNENS